MTQLLGSVVGDGDDQCAKSRHISTVIAAVIQFKDLDTCRLSTLEADEKKRVCISCKQQLLRALLSVTHSRKKIQLRSSFTTNTKLDATPPAQQHDCSRDKLSLPDYCTIGDMRQDPESSRLTKAVIVIPRESHRLVACTEGQSQA